MFQRTRKLPGENFYSQIPNHWIRDHRLTAMEFKVLCFWASHEVGYRVTIQQTIAEIKEGRDAIYRAVAELVKHEYLIRSQGRTGEPTGRGGKTKFAQVDYELGPAAYEQMYERNWGRGAKPQVVPLPEKADAVEGEDVSAGQTASGETGSGSTASGRTDTKKTNSLEDQVKGEQNPPPPTPAEGPAEPSSPDQEGEEGSPEGPDQRPAVRVLAAALAAAGARNPIAASRTATLTGLLAPRLAAGWTEQAALAALSDPLVGTQSAYAIMKWRITNLLDGAPPANLPRQAPKTPIPPWCGRCESSDYRWVDTPNGVAKCTTCHPHAAVPAGAR